MTGPVVAARRAEVRLTFMSERRRRRGGTGQGQQYQRDAIILGARKLEA